MDSFELNKIAGAVLSALLLIFGSTTMLEVMSGGHGDSHAKAAYKLPEPEASASASHGKDAEKATEEAGFDAAKVVALLASANADSGKKLFKQCKACHTETDGGRNGVGPNLWDIVGRGRGAVDGFKYSTAMKEKGGNWDYASLAAFMHEPKKMAQGHENGLQGHQEGPATRRPDCLPAWPERQSEAAALRVGMHLVSAGAPSQTDHEQSIFYCGPANLLAGSLCMDRP